MKFKMKTLCKAAEKYKNRACPVYKFKMKHYNYFLYISSFVCINNHINDNKYI